MQKRILEINKVIKNVLIPPQINHWKTPLLISLLFWITSGLTVEDQELRDFFAIFSWLFLTISLGWRTTQKPFIIQGISLSPWVVATLICLLIAENLSPNLQYLALVIWPVLSICLAVMIHFFITGAKLEPSPPFVRPVFLILILSQVLLSCLLEFHFIIQNWLTQYPSLLAEDFSRSGFVINFAQPSLTRSRGIIIINLMEQQLRAKTNNKPWVLVEEWLINVNNGRVPLGEEAFKKLSKLPENPKWELRTEIVQGQSLYRIQLLAKWQGPSSFTGGYTLSKTCEVTKNITVGELKCNPIKRLKSKPLRDSIEGETQA